MTESSVQQGAEIPAYISLVSGAFSGVIARLFVAPVDVIKIRMQLQSNARLYGTITSTISTIWKNEGFAAFWKGNVSAEIMYLIYGSAQFTSYSFLNTHLSRFEKKHSMNIPTAIHSLTIGAIAGCAATCSSYPFDLLRTRLISNEKPRFVSLYREIKDILVASGCRGFFGGGFLSVLSVALTTGFSFAGYNVLKGATFGTIFEPTSGLIAGALSKFLVYPLDLLKRRRQITTSCTVSQTAVGIFQKEGLRGFYHGLIPSIVKSAPTTMLSLYFYELASGQLLRMEESKRLNA